MSSQRFSILVAVLAILIVLTTYRPLQAQSPERQLPADLLYVSRIRDEQGYSQARLMRIDAQTLQAHLFFENTDARYLNLNPIGWSPQGNFLAIVASLDGAEWVVCILDQDGAAQMCNENVMDRDTRMERYQISWSPDEQYVYYVTESERVFSLVEVEVSTGTINRTIFQHRDDIEDENPPLIYWTPELDKIMLFENYNFYSGEFGTEVGMWSVFTVNPQSGLKASLNSRIPFDWGEPAFCFGYSPMGNYIVAKVYMDRLQPSFVIMDRDGFITQTISYDRLSTYSIDRIGCPSWQQNEEAFYFLGYFEEPDAPATYRAYVFRYDLQSDDLQVYEDEGTPINYMQADAAPLSPLIVSPQNTHLAVRYRVNGPVGNVGIIFPDGSLMRLGDIDDHIANPIWLPNP